VRTGNLFVVSGPSGVGKDTVLAELLALLPDVKVCITATTRAMRAGESQGNPYQFMSVTEFETLVNEDAFLEYAHVNGGNLYGTPRRWVEETCAQGTDVILKIDVQGGLAVRKKLPEAILVFLEPPSLAELERRLRARSTETEDQVKVRLLDARNELAQRPHYNYAILNEDVTLAADRLRAVILAERYRVRP